MEFYRSFINRRDLADDENRRIDVAKFWADYQKHPYSQSGFMDRLRRGVLQTAEKHLPFVLPPDTLATATATLGLFVYSADMARRMRPKLTSKYPLPPLLINLSSNSFGHSYYLDDNWNVSASCFVASIPYLLYPESSFSSQVGPWKYETKKSVSQYLSDKIIVETALAGVEEYAHELFVRLKCGEKLMRSELDSEQIQNRVSDLNQKGQHEYSDVVYHTKDIEKRALFWQAEFARKHFPHWAKPTHNLISRVFEERKKQNGTKQ